MVVADEEEGCLGVVGGVTDKAAEVCGLLDAAVGHEVVDVVDDDECWLELADEILDAHVEGIEVVALGAEDVEADEVEVVARSGVGCELVVDGGADVGAVDGVYPENLAAGGGAGGTGGLNGGRAAAHGT